MSEVEVVRATLQKQANRIANLTLDLDLAHSQIEILTAESQPKEDEKEV